MRRVFWVSLVCAGLVSSGCPEGAPLGLEGLVSLLQPGEALVSPQLEPEEALGAPASEVVPEESELEEPEFLFLPGWFTFAPQQADDGTSCTSTTAFCLDHDV